MCAKGKTNYFTIDVSKKQKNTLPKIWQIWYARKLNLKCYSIKKWKQYWNRLNDIKPKSNHHYFFFFRGNQLLINFVIILDLKFIFVQFNHCNIKLILHAPKWLNHVIITYMIFFKEHIWHLQFKFKIIVFQIDLDFSLIKMYYIRV